ncbi:DNA repair protein RecN [Ammoniphilus sp. CFH 90114]|uniref:DNA repair protein RecN n=1 Tax=Ammoniphilus sp. CFH 90114 TaxID=2493665 RepID=UPI00100DAAA3|nr:DNA repair protein RecN [Ammoniphilus sp. CFH 90114]RXT13797.1 DNA repair protein RecN [Ammoniphilus sp. CFH 90114]
MIVELTIKNLAVIKHVTIPFQTGLNILTGETGAGKSILIDAIGFLLGGRGSADYVRYGEKKAEIEALFEVEQDHPLFELLPQLGIEPPDDGMLILKRDITAQGKSICRINGQLVTLATLKEVGPWLVNIHGQHEHQSLMDADRHLNWLDAFAGEELRSSKEEYGQVYRDYRTARSEYIKFAKNEQHLAQRQDMLAFQLQEITEANLQPLEDEEMMKGKIRLVNGEKLYKGIDDAYSSLTGEHASLDWVGLALSNLESITAYDESLNEIQVQLEAAFFQLEEVARSLRSYRDSLDFDPFRLQEIEDRLGEIQRLKRKYGKSVEEILEYAASIEDELDSIVNREERLVALKGRVKDLAQDLAIEAVELSTQRQIAAAHLSLKIEEQLKDLHMEKAKFSIEVRYQDDQQGIEVNGSKVRVKETGIDEVEFMISPNPGEPLRPVAKIASGGELSRIMLGMKAILADLEPIGALIFDEVDTGVSGRAAQAIAEKLVAVSRNKQVLCITHLPQMACMADAHFYISKTASDTETMTRVEYLTEAERVNELARLLGGVEVTETTRNHAREMLKLAEQSKENIQEPSHN